MFPTRLYDSTRINTDPNANTKTEEPRVGDVVSMFDHAYGTGIITSINKKENTMVVERVYCSISGSPVEDGRGSIQIGIERVTYFLDSIHRSALKVYTQGGVKGEVDNRARGH